MNPKPALSRRRFHLLTASALASLGLSTVLSPRMALATAGEHTVNVPALPKTVEEFIKLRDSLAKTPQGAAAVFAVAGILYSQDQSLGLGALTTMIDSKWLTNGTAGYSGKEPSKIDQQRFKDRWSKARGLDYVPRSYVQGTSPANQYAIPPGKLVFKIKEQGNSKESDSVYKMFVHCTGAASPRPLKLVKVSTGIWKATEWSSLTSGIQKPAAPAQDEI